MGKAIILVGFFNKRVKGGGICRLHPLIHTLLEFNLLQDVERINKRSQELSTEFGSLVSR